MKSTKENTLTEVNEWMKNKQKDKSEWEKEENKDKEKEKECVLKKKVLKAI